MSQKIQHYLEHRSQTGRSQWMQLKEDGSLVQRHCSRSLMPDEETDLLAIFNFDATDVKMVSSKIQRGSFNCSSTFPFFLALACLSTMLSLNDHLCLVGSDLPLKICRRTSLNRSPLGESCSATFKKCFFQNLSYFAENRKQLP